MKFNFSVQEPKKIMFSLLIEGSLKDFEELQEGLKDYWPASELCSVVNSMYFKAARHFSPEIPNDTD